MNLSRDERLHSFNWVEGRMKGEAANETSSLGCCEDDGRISGTLSWNVVSDILTV